ncbi:glycosyltransferase family 4 protein [Sediminibacillus halophilus]|uniref:Glycosyltransferase involved in cell wall bisynthesis n=1 Tax=Sediminibacillus halophilus TaxID=482461 RepID=A0A1G9U9G3_9BACI|nr:glycosyltransferase family 4 protein [Sediminibacillus halophilus]SDM56354.1 Glycosyltransferase involved in cell wall bisynthesis [Sediminibacillus halophilus]
MKKNIWIFNHYATKMYKDQAGRHYWFCENLIKDGFNPTIFCATTIHNSAETISTNDHKFISDKTNEVPFVFVQTPKYKGNGKQRIKNMVAFYKNLFPVAKEYSKQHGTPDIILASSVHPLTMVAGIKIAKKYRVPCICEVRDLWPETLVAYDSIKKNSLPSKLLYLGEKWIYKKADKIIFTMEGGIDYIKNKKWDLDSGGPIDLNKVFHVNNGVDLKTFKENKERNIINDDDLNCKETFKVIYTGSIGKANNVKKIVNIAKVISDTGNNKIRFLIYGDGIQKEELETYCDKKNLRNIKFKGFVEKNKIPYILSKSNLNIFHFEQNSLKKYGASLNKMFEYFASGKPILSDCEFGYDLIKKHKSGIVVDNGSAEQLANEIIRFSNMTKSEYDLYCNNAYNLAKEYDFRMLTTHLEKIL